MNIFVGSFSFDRQKLTDAWTKGNLLPSLWFSSLIFERFCVATCASVFFFVFCCTHNIVSMQFCCCVVYALDGFLYFCDANTNTMHEKATPFGNRIGCWVDCKLEKGSKSITWNAEENSIPLSPSSNFYFWWTQEISRNNSFRSNANN